MDSRKRLQPWLKNSVGEGKFGLMWIDKKNQIFGIPWMHKSNPAWKEDYFQVFKEWSMVTKMYNKEEKWSTLKTRLRTALNKLPDFKEISSMHNKKGPPYPYKAYKFITRQEKRVNLFLCSDSIQNSPHSTVSIPSSALPSPSFGKENNASYSNKAFGTYQKQRDNDDSSSNSESIQGSPQSTVSSPSIDLPSVSVSFGKEKNAPYSYYKYKACPLVTNQKRRDVDNSISNVECFSVDSNPQSTVCHLSSPQTSNPQSTVCHLSSPQTSNPQSTVCHLSSPQTSISFLNFDAERFSFLSSSEDSQCGLQPKKSQPISQPSHYFDPPPSDRLDSNTQKNNACCWADNNPTKVKSPHNQQGNYTSAVYEDVNEYELNGVVDQQQTIGNQEKSTDLGSLPSDLKTLTTSDLMAFNKLPYFFTEEKNLCEAAPMKSTLIYKIFYGGDLVKEGYIYESGAQFYFGQMPKCDYLGHLPGPKHPEKIEFPDINVIKISRMFYRQKIQSILSNLEAGFHVYCEGGNIYAKRSCRTRIFASNNLLENIALDRTSNQSIKLFDFTNFRENVLTLTSPLVLLSFALPISVKTFGKLLVHVELIPVEGKELQDKVKAESFTGNDVQMLSNDSLVFDSEDIHLDAQMSNLSL